MGTLLGVMLWGTIVMAGGVVLLIVFASHLGLIVMGIVLWGLGASLGLPGIRGRLRGSAANRVLR